jgi:hypothetical protein
MKRYHHSLKVLEEQYNKLLILAPNIAIICVEIHLLHDYVNTIENIGILCYPRTCRDGSADGHRITSSERSAGDASHMRKSGSNRADCKLSWIAELTL